MLDEQNGDPERLAHSTDERHHLGGLARVHAGCRFVEHEQLRTCRERPPDLETPLLSIGEIAGDDIAAATQSDEMQQLQRFLMGSLLVPPRVRRVQQRPPPMRAEMQMHADQQVLHRGDVTEQPDVLIGATDPESRDAIGRQPIDTFAGKPNLTAGNLQVLHDAIENRRLSRAVRADHAVYGAFADAKVKLAHGDEAAKAHGEPFRLQDLPSSLARHLWPRCLRRDFPRLVRSAFYGGAQLPTTCRRRP